MKVRQKSWTDCEFDTGRFNVHGLSEVIGHLGNSGSDSFLIEDLDVWIEALGEWKDMLQAFRDRDLIRDNYNTIFFEPKTKEDRARGYTL